MPCAILAIPREPEADDDDEWGGDDYELPDDAHWNDECPATAGSLTAPTLGEAVTELHGQAHGPGPVLLCRRQPCRSLDIDQLRALT
jgi:hypothetical protein